MMVLRRILESKNITDPLKSLRQSGIGICDCLSDKDCDIFVKHKSYIKCFKKKKINIEDGMSALKAMFFF